MTLEEAIAEWRSKPRRAGCVAATKFLTSRVPGWYPARITRFTKDGDTYDHVVATDGFIVIDLAPYADKPKPVKPHPTKVNPPCLATTSAYGTVMACGRPKGHGLLLAGEIGFVWGEGHTETPRPYDERVYRVDHDDGGFHASWEEYKR